MLAAFLLAQILGLLWQMSVRGCLELNWPFVAQPPVRTMLPSAAATAPCFSLVLKLVHAELLRLILITDYSVTFPALIIFPKKIPNSTISRAN
jgi:hypothetical protein